MRDQISESYKIGEGFNEVDLVDLEHNLLCEITVSDKKVGAVHLKEHFSNSNMIRILTAHSYTVTERGYYMIPYPELCMKIDNKSIYQLPIIIA